MLPAEARIRARPLMSATATTAGSSAGSGKSRFFGTEFLRSFVAVTLGGAIIAASSAALGGAAG